MNETNLPYLTVELTGKAFNKLGWLTEEETHFAVVLPAYKDLVNAITKTLIVFGWLAIFAFQNHAANLETIDYNGSSYFHANQSGTSEPDTWLNKSDGLANLANGPTIQDALNRFKWLKFEYGLARITPTFQYLSIPGMDTWAVSGYNTTDYWEADSQKCQTIGGQTVCLLWRYSQQQHDDLINYHLEANSSHPLALPQDAYLVMALTKIDISSNANCDNATIGNETNLWTQSLCRQNDYWTFNATGLELADTASKGWQWDFTQNNASFIYIKAGPNSSTNGEVYVGFLVGRQLTAFATEYRGMDETCVPLCGLGDVITFYSDDSQMPATNVQVAVNGTYSCSWTDNLGTCTPGGCRLHAWGVAAGGTGFAPGTYAGICDVGNAPGYIVLDVANTTPAYQGRGGCAVTDINPPKGWFNWSVTEIGRYTQGVQSFSHLLRCGFQVSTGSATDLLLGADTVAPKATAYYINGATFPNNSIVNVYSSNGSLAYANITFTVEVGKNTEIYGGPSTNGTLNMTGIRMNMTGFTFNLSPYNLWTPYNLQSVMYWDVKNGTPYQYCFFANGTNRGTGTGDSNFSTTGAFYCWWATLNIIPIPVSNPTPFAAKPGYRKDDDDTLLAKQDYNWWWLIIPLVLVLVFLYTQKRT